MGLNNGFSVNSCESLQSFQSKISKIFKRGKNSCLSFVPYCVYGLDFALNSSLRNISGDIFDTTDEIALSSSAVVEIAGNFKKCSLYIHKEELEMEPL